MPKSESMERLLDSLARVTYGRERTASIAEATCVSCGGPASQFADELSRKEYAISGFCQVCQDKMFG